jgi:hypothetical protein
METLLGMVVDRRPKVFKIAARTAVASPELGTFDNSRRLFRSAFYHPTTSRADRVARQTLVCWPGVATIFVVDRQHVGNVNRFNILETALHMQEWLSSPGLQPPR